MVCSWHANAGQLMLASSIVMWIQWNGGDGMPHSLFFGGWLLENVALKKKSKLFLSYCPWLQHLYSASIWKLSFIACLCLWKTQSVLLCFHDWGGAEGSDSIVVISQPYSSPEEDTVS